MEFELSNSQKAGNDSEPSVTFYERGGAAAGARSNMAKVAEMNISFRAIKISQSTKVNCDIGNGSLPLAEKAGFEPASPCGLHDFQSCSL